MARVLDIERIKNSPMITEPWEHKVIDNFFPPEVFEKIKAAATFLTKEHTIEGKTNPMWMNECLRNGADPEAVQHIIDAADDILDNIEFLMDDFTEHQTSAQGYFSMPKFGISGPNFTYPVHSESSHKVINFVTYIYPEVDEGTRLYKTHEESSYVKSVDWKENRTFLMTTNHNNDVTWHNWTSEKYNNPSRVTLNIFCEKMELLQESILNSGKVKGQNHLEERVDDMLWLYDQFSKGHLTSTK